MLSVTWPKISIITPVFNSVSTLEKTIQSVIKQRYPNLEHIVLDGGSTDGTLAIIEKYRDKLNFLGSRKDLGPADAYNQGIAAAQGEWILMLSADDWLANNVLIAMGEIGRDKELDVISGYAEVVRQNSPNNYVLIRKYGYKHCAFTLPIVMQSVLSNSRLYRKRLFEQYGYFNVLSPSGAYFIGNDREWLMRLATHPINNYRLKKTVCIYLQHARALTTNADPTKKLSMFWENVEANKLFCQQYSLTPSQIKMIKNDTLLKLSNIVTRGIILQKWSDVKKAFQAGCALKKSTFTFFLALSAMHLIPITVRKIRIGLATFFKANN